MPDQISSPAEPRADAGNRVLRFWARNWTSIVLLTVLAGVLTLQSVRWPWGLRLAGTLVAGAVTIRLDEGLDAEPDMVLQPAKASLVGTSWVRPPSELAPGQSAAASLRVTAAELHLSALHLAKGAELTLQREQGGRFSLRAGGAGGTLTFTADGPLSMQFGDTVLKADQDASGLELSAGTAPNMAAPLVLTAQMPGSQPPGVSALADLLNGQLPSPRSDSALSLSDIPVSLLRFGRPREGGGGFVSSIVSGTVQLVDLGDTETLGPGSAVRIEGFHGDVARLESVDDGYRLSFTGEADRVSLGPPGFAEDLTPSILNYLFHQESIKMMWLSALAGLAAFAKVGSWFAGKFEE